MASSWPERRAFSAAMASSFSVDVFACAISISTPYRAPGPLIGGGVVHWFELFFWSCMRAISRFR